MKTPVLITEDWSTYYGGLEYFRRRTEPMVYKRKVRG